MQETGIQIMPDAHEGEDDQNVNNAPENADARAAKGNVDVLHEPKVKGAVPEKTRTFPEPGLEISDVKAILGT